MTDCTSWATATWRNLIVQALDKLQCDCCGLLFVVCGILLWLVPFIRCIGGAQSWTSALVTLGLVWAKEKGEENIQELISHSSMSAPIHGSSCFIIIRWHKLMDQMGVKSYIILGYLGFCCSLFSLPYMCQNGEQDANNESWVTADASDSTSLSKTLEKLDIKLPDRALLPQHQLLWIK